MVIQSEMRTLRLAAHIIMMDSPRSQLGLRLAGHCPLLARVFVSALLRQHDVQQHEVVLGGLQAGHGGPDCGEHAPEQERHERDVRIYPQWWDSPVWLSDQSSDCVCDEWSPPWYLHPALIVYNPRISSYPNRFVCLAWELSDNCINYSPEWEMEILADSNIQKSIGNLLALFYEWLDIYVKFLLWIRMLRSEYCKVQL